MYIPPTPPRPRPPHKLHLIQKEPSFFIRQPLDNVLMWQRHIEIILNPAQVPEKGKITQHFKKPKPTRAKKRKKTEDTTPTKKNKKKKTKTITQPQISTFFQTPVLTKDPTHDEPEPPLPIEERRYAAQGPRRSQRLRHIKRPLAPTTQQTNTPAALPKPEPPPAPKPRKLCKPSDKFKSYQSKMKFFL